MKDKVQTVIADWLDDNFADLQPWEEDDVIEQDMWDDLWKRLNPLLLTYIKELCGEPENPPKTSSNPEHAWGAIYRNQLRQEILENARKELS